MNKRILFLSFVFVVCVVVFFDNLYAQDMDEIKSVFENKCSQCHPTSKALNKTKDLDGWKITTTRMSKKSGSNISEQEVKNIAEYLFSLNNDSENNQQ